MADKNSARTNQLSGQHRHVEDDGTLSFFIDENGNFGIVCDRGHGWYGKWEDVLTFYEPNDIDGDRRMLTGEQFPRESDSDTPEWFDAMMEQQQTQE